MTSHAFQSCIWQLSPRHELALTSPRVLAILNLTPDSFSDGSSYPTLSELLAAAEHMLANGAEAFDIGGESTRPGAQPVSAQTQIERTVPAIAAIRKHLGDKFPITIDTTRSEVAAAAIDAGADAINDTSAGEDDPVMLATAAKLRAGIILMHRLRPPSGDQFSTQYASAPTYPGGVVATIKNYLHARAEAAKAAGISSNAIVLDPGLGFGKSVEDNLTLINESATFAALGYPILSALSRKSFTVRAAGLPDTTPPRERLEPTLKLSVQHLLAAPGAVMLFRVHDVAEHVRALQSAWRNQP